VGSGTRPTQKQFKKKKIKKKNKKIKNKKIKKKKKKIFCSFDDLFFVLVVFYTGFSSYCYF
jgi:hypothetical protein